LVTTEKDAVRLPFERMTDLPLYYLRLEIDIISGVDDFEDAVSRICFSQLPAPAGAGTRSTDFPYARPALPETRPNSY